MVEVVVLRSKRLTRRKSPQVSWIEFPEFEPHKSEPKHQMSLYNVSLSIVKMNNHSSQQSLPWYAYVFLHCYVHVNSLHTVR